MYDMLRLFCENLKSIGVKMTEIWSCKSPPLRSDFELQRTFKRVFSHLAFSESVNSLAEIYCTNPFKILLTFSLHKLRGNSVEFFFLILTYFKITKFPNFFCKIGVLTSKCCKKLKNQ